MPLSEHERRQLEQIEQALRADDPRFADAVHAADPRVHYKRRVIAAALGFVIGVGLLLAGVVINVIPVAVAGFVVMLACSLWAVTSYRRMTGITTGRVPAQARRAGNQRRGAKGGRAGKQAGIGADGAAGGALAAPPGAWPLSPGCPLPSLSPPVPVVHLGTAFSVAMRAAARNRAVVVRIRKTTGTGLGLRSDAARHCGDAMGRSHSRRAGEDAARACDPHCEASSVLLMEGLGHGRRCACEPGGRSGDARDPRRGRML